MWENFKKIAANLQIFNRILKSFTLQFYTIYIFFLFQKPIVSICLLCAKDSNILILLGIISCAKFGQNSSICYFLGILLKWKEAGSYIVTNSFTKLSWIINVFLRPFRITLTYIDLYVTFLRGSVSRELNIHKFLIVTIPKLLLLLNIRIDIGMFE